MESALILSYPHPSSTKFSVFVPIRTPSIRIFSVERQHVGWKQVIHPPRMHIDRNKVKGHRAKFGIIKGQQMDGMDTSKREPELSLVDMKRSLMKAVSGTNAGQKTVTPEQQQRTLNLIKELAKRNPTPDPIQSPLVAGSWALLYSTPNDEATVDKYAGSFEGPFLARLKPLSLGAVRRKNVTQVIDSEEKRIDNVAQFSALGLSGFLNVCGKYEDSPSIPGRGLVRLDVTFTSFVLSVGDKFKITVPLTWFNPEGWVETLYLDNDMRIVLGDKGTIFVTSRLRQS